MTFEEAREIFLNRGYEQVDGGSIYNPDKWRESIIVISDWLQQEPCEDAINRQMVLEIQAKYAEDIGATKFWQMRDDIKALPPVTPHPKTGHWIRWYERKEDDWVVENIPHCKCSECGKEYDSHSSQFVKYCIECGAKMVEPQESEDKE